MQTILPKSYGNISSRFLAKDPFKNPQALSVFFQENEHIQLPLEQRTFRSITKGDLHGNIVNAVRILIKLGAISFHPNDFHCLESIFHETDCCFSDDYQPSVTSTFSKKNYLNLIAVFSRMQVINTGTTFRFLGDILNDRRGNSYMNMTVFYLLNKAGLKIEILWSNHDLDFFENLNPHNLFETAVKIKNQGRNCHVFSFDDDFSLGIEMIEIINWYRSQLKLISYSLQNNTIYTHAPVDHETLAQTIEKICPLLDIEVPSSFFAKLTDGSLTEIIFDTLVHSINEKLSMLEKSSNKIDVIQRIHPFVWFRTKLDQKNDICLNNKLILHVHGHDGFSKSTVDVTANGKICLDTPFGKVRNSFSQIPMFDAIYMSTENLEELTELPISSNSSIQDDVNREYDLIFGVNEEDQEETGGQ